MQPTSEQLQRDPVLLADIIRPIKGTDEGYQDATVSKIETDETGSIVAISLVRPYIHTSEVEYSASPRYGSKHKAASAIVYTGLEQWTIELSALTDGLNRFYRVVYRRTRPLA